MSLNLFIKELKSNLKGNIVLSLSVALYIASSMGIYSIMTRNIAKVVDFYAVIPESLRIALNFNLNQWSNVLGFYITYFIYYVPIVIGCYAIILGTKILSKEEQHKTAEFLLTRPISREQVISSKLLAFIAHILGINLVVFLVALFSCGIVSDWNFKIASLSVLHTYGALMCIFFGVLGFFITVLMKRAKAIVGIGIGIVLGSYLFDMTIRISDRVQFLLYLTPFKYLDLNILSEDYGFDAWRLLFFFGASGVLILFSYVVYRKKDILI